MKPAIVLVARALLRTLPAGEIRKWRAIWPALLLLGVPALLILLQPDLGTAIMVVLGGVTVMFLAGVPWWLFVGGAAAAIAVAAPIAVQHDARLPAQADRSSSSIPKATRSAPATISAQSKIAIGSGGICGKGFLHGSQSHLDYLPEGHTDFVFATMVEEWGLVGGADR